MLYGSNAGTSRAFAERIASDGAQRGFDVRPDGLDSGAGDQPADGATVLVTSSYEGPPPDSAKASVSWVRGLEQDSAPMPTPGVDVELVGAVREPMLHAGGLAMGTVVSDRELVTASAPGSDGREPWTGSTRHVEIALPAGMTYRPGDYLAVLPTNTLVTAGELLSSWVELGQPATRRQVELLAGSAACPRQTVTPSPR